MTKLVQLDCTNLSDDEEERYNLVCIPLENIEYISGRPQIKEKKWRLMGVVNLKSGARLLCQESGLRVVSLDFVGGLLSFLGHTFSTIFLGLFGVVPGLRWVAHFLNRAISRVIISVDRKVDRSGLFALNYHVIGEKTDG